MKLRFFALLLTAVPLTVTVTPASAQCVNNLPGVNVTYASTLNFNIQGTLLTPSQVQSGIGMWQTCAQYGSGFPSMVVNGSGSININIQHIAGSNPDPNSACGKSYWSYSNGSLTGGTINLFDATTYGGDCESTMAETIAHEIGHALGMNDVSASCLPDIMGPNNLQAGSRRVLSQDCTDVNNLWQTPQETPPPPPPSPSPTEDTTMCSGCDPLILDLSGDGVQTTDKSDPVWFDLNGDGVKDHITWTNAKTMAGFLYIDLNHKSRVDDGRELFGSGTVMPDGTRAKDGFQALSIYDDPQFGGNGDGILDANDEVWNHLRIWIDVNHNGICEPGETGPVHEYGVEAILLSAVRTNFRDPAGNTHVLQGTYIRRSLDNGASPGETFAVDSIAFQRVP